MGPKSVVNIGSVSAEIYLIWSQMSLEQMLPWQMSSWHLASVEDGPRNLSLKFGQNLISNRWDIPDMDKCHHDKCSLDKCTRDSLNLFKMVLGTYVYDEKWWQWRWRCYMVNMNTKIFQSMSIPFRSRSWILFLLAEFK